MAFVNEVAGVKFIVFMLMLLSKVNSLGHKMSLIEDKMKSIQAKLKDTKIQVNIHT